MYKIGLIILLFLVGCSKDNGSNAPVAPTAPQIEAAEWRISSIEVGELDFGLVDFDKQKMLTINILNDGPVTLPSTPVISNSDFSLAFSSCNNLQPKDKCVIKVVFNAKDKEDGTYTANLVYGDAINTLTAQINRSGQVVESSFKSSGLFITDYNFGVIEYRHNLMKTILVVNSGTELMNSTITLTGSGFRKVYDKCSNVPLKPKQSCLVKVVLSGQGLTGAVSGQMTYADKSLSFTATVKTQKQLAQENSEFVFVYNNVNHSTMPIDLQTINLNEIK